jgi:predicted RNase H-like HicB family nuclease
MSVLRRRRRESYCDLEELMKVIRVIYHYEDESWWAESPDIKGWTAVADTHAEIVQLVEEGIPFALECQALEQAPTANANPVA